jgi:hypothetical protein
MSRMHSTQVIKVHRTFKRDIHTFIINPTVLYVHMSRSLFIYRVEATVPVRI